MSFMGRENTLFTALLLCGSLFFLISCGSMRRAAVGSFTGEEALMVYSSDDDPELVREAMPFGLKTFEILIAEDPSSKALHLAAAAGFVQYASAFIEDDAERIVDSDFKRARELRKRAARLYMRGSEYAFTGLEVEHPGFRELFRENKESALTWMEKKDVPFLFLGGAGWIGAISNDPSNMAKLAELSAAEAIMRRALELDEGYNDGAVHEFFISFEGGRSEAMGGSTERAREHYRRAVELTEGKKASPHVALASSVAVRLQELGEFRELLGKALAVDSGEVKKWQLSNKLAQSKARWLLEHTADLFVEFEEDGD